MIPVHSKLLTKAARNVLRPMGLVQKGRSRIWLDDRNWWLGLVEFQPSSWSQGSYLNVGCMWLWHVKDHFSFDEGYRVEDFAAYESETQFEPVAMGLAERAAKELRLYRDRFQSIYSVCTYYSDHQPQGFWPNFHAAIAFALAGQVDAARFHASAVRDTPDGQQWLTAAKREMEEHLPFMASSPRFRHFVEDKVMQARAVFGLAPITEVAFD